MCIWIQYKYVDFICLASNYWKFRRKDSTGCFEMVVSNVPKVAMACARKQYPSSNNNANKAGMATIEKSLLLMFESPLDSDSSQCHTIDAQIEKMWNLFLGQQNIAKQVHKSQSLSRCDRSTQFASQVKAKIIFVFNRAVVAPQPSHYEAQEGTSMRGLDPTVFVLGEATHMSLPWKGKAHVWWSIKYDQMCRMRLANAMNLMTLPGDHITRSFSSRGTSALNILAIGWMINCEWVHS